MNTEFTGDFLQQMRGFYYAATTGSIIKAASIMHRSQSSVSRLIQQFEASLGVTLLQRHNNGVRLTAEGERIMGMVIAIFEQLSLLHSEVTQQPFGPVEGAVSVLMAQVIYMHFMRPLLPALRRELPGLELNFCSPSSGIEGILHMIHTHSVDFAIASKPDYLDHFEFEPLFSSRMLLAVPGELAARLHEPISFETLVALPCIELPAATAPMMYIRRHLPPHMSLKAVHFAFSHQARADLVKAGYGAAILDEYVVQSHLSGQDNVRVFTLDHLFPPRRFGLVYRKKACFTLQAKAFMAFLKRNRQLPPTSN